MRPNGFLGNCWEHNGLMAFQLQRRRKAERQAGARYCDCLRAHATLRSNLTWSAIAQRFSDGAHPRTCQCNACSSGNYLDHA